MVASPPECRLFRATGDHVVVALVAVEFLLLLSERFQWLALNQHKGCAVLIASALAVVVVLLGLNWLIASMILHWRFQFSIRTLLLLMLAVAIPFAWLSAEMKRANEQRLIAETFDNANIDWNYAYDPGGESLLQRRVRMLFGIDFVAGIDRASPTDNARLKTVAPTLISASWNLTQAGLPTSAGIPHGFFTTPKGLALQHCDKRCWVAISQRPTTAK